MEYGMGRAACGVGREAKGERRKAEGDLDLLPSLEGAGVGLGL